jgi:hypothetical protein
VTESALYNLITKWEASAKLPETVETATPQQVFAACKNQGAREQLAKCAAELRKLAGESHVGQ